MFKKAVQNVAKAHQVSRVAREAGIQRETLYRSFSTEGNPTLDTLLSVLGALKLRIRITADSPEFATPPPTALQAHAGVVRRTRQIRHLTELRNAGQLEFAFPIQNAGSGTIARGTFDTVRIANIGTIFSSIAGVQYGVGPSTSHLSHELSGLLELAGLIPPPYSTGVQYAAKP